jgi:hypothetical protein
VALTGRHTRGAILNRAVVQVCMCERVCRDWYGISKQTGNAVWRALWFSRGWTAPGHGTREDSLIQSGRVPSEVCYGQGARMDAINRRAKWSLGLRRRVALQEDGVSFSEWKGLYQARHLDEVELNSQASKIVEQSMRQLSAFRSAVAEQRLLQEAKLEQRLLVRRAIRRQHQQLREAAAVNNPISL